jgi:acyl transferase domain-containing protein
MVANEKDYGPRSPQQQAAIASHRLLHLLGRSPGVRQLGSGHCDLALAGGAAITCPPRSGYLYQEGGMLSVDGHTRAFDADAQGTVFSDGVAVVLLKRLRDAVADQDTIYGVIAGPP